MNELSILLNFIIARFQNDSLVNSISIVPTLEIDNNKENIYPLVNIDLRESEVQDDVLECSFKITVVQQRNSSPIVEDSKLLDNTNFIDNMNETHSICQKFINYLTRQNNTQNIEIGNVTKMKALKLTGMSGLDGWQFDIDLHIPNIGSSC